MLVVFNWRGVVCSAAALGVGGYLDHVGKSSLFALAAGTVMISTDSALRHFKSKPDAGARFQRWYLPAAGGHLWFVPVWAIGVFLFLSGAVANYAAAHRAPDPAHEAYDADAKTLTEHPVVGYPTVEPAQKLQAYFEEKLDPALNPRSFHVLTRVTETRALILLRAPCLKQLTEDARRDLLSLIEGRARLLFPDRQLFVGVSGMVLMGIVKTPAAGTTLETSDEDPLWAFYAKGPTGH